MTGPAVILLGAMGAGKTSVGRELAARLDLPFDDLDAMIVAEAGRPIPDIFAHDGEDGFRRLEAAVLERALSASRGTRGVLSLGGGAVMAPESRERLRGGPIVLLEVEEQVAAVRLGRGHGRPMLAGGEDPMIRWRELAAERGPVYRELARWRIDAGRGTAPAVARAITDMMGQDLLSGPEEKNA
ncbi:shikimate kinase [Brachybacterium fresconis]|uniref:Shikimate kinase n=1 Tax=Brachybacterium fresconis TaxID=173363 RepID=A0ABS4YEP4_9MICO|nr:shikimate kinase [Brachybacterium fresconis]